MHVCPSIEFFLGRRRQGKYWLGLDWIWPTKTPPFGEDFARNKEKEKKEKMKEEKNEETKQQFTGSCSSLLMLCCLV